MKNIKTIAAIAACAMLMGGCASSGKVAMKIGDEKITDKEIAFFATELLGGANDFDNAKTAAVDMIESAYLTMEVAEAWGLQLTDEEEKEVKSALINIRSQFGSKSEFDKVLKTYGVDEDFVFNLLKESTYAEKINGAIEISTATDEEAQAFFKDNYLRAKHVLLTTNNMATGEEYNKDEILAKANDVLARAQAGEDFDALIAEFNEDPGMASNPDGYVFGADEMVKEFEDTTRGLEPGKIAMCETDYGYHIILRLPLDETPEKFTEFYEAKKSAVNTALKESKQDAALQEKANEYGIAVETNDDIIANLEPVTTPEPKED